MDHRAVRKSLMEEKLKRYNDDGDLREGECPGCGWDVSSHAISQYGLDCPPGIMPSPAAKARRLPSRK